MSAPTHDAFEIDVLALNSGSSSLKFGLYRVGPTQTDLLLGGEAESIGEGAAGKFHVRDAHDNVLQIARHTRALVTSGASR
jgi:acetate kinase